MSRIQTNVPSLLAQRTLNQNTRELNTSLERLSTGFRINRGADDPSGLIASENLRSEQASITAAIDNAERAELVVNIAEGGLQEVNNLLLEVQGLIGASANEAGLSGAEREANQLEIDSIIQTIDRISSTTSFQGTRLLNGNFDFQTTGADAADVSDVTVNAALLQFDGERAIDVQVTGAAERAGAVLDLGATTVNPDPGESFSFEVAGREGSREFTFGSGATVDDVAEAINTFTDVTGVTASAAGNTVSFLSTGFGDDEFVEVDVTGLNGQGGDIAQLSGSVASTVDTQALAAVTGTVRDEGVDVTANINGVQARTEGLNVSVSTDFLDVEIDLTEAGGTTTGTVDAGTITGGGANFNLGPQVNIGNQVSIGIGNIAARNLGSQESGFLSELAAGASANVVDGDLGRAQRIVNDAIEDVTSLRGRLGAFQANTVGASIRSLGVALENTSAAESSIRDTDFAEETSALTRAQVLQQSATNILSLANSAPQSALSLLG